MRKINAIILCASAMSSSIIVEALRKAALDQGVDLTVNCSASLRYRTFDFGSVDIVLIAPQVKGQMEGIRKFAAEKGHDQLPFLLIPMREYGLAKGDTILKLMLKELGNAPQ